MNGGMSVKFPNDWPEDCPPIEAEDAEGVVYRICKKDPPAESDFLSHFETGRMKHAPPCLRAGLSVLRTIGDARHLARLFPSLGAFIAQGRLRPEHGKTAPTKGKVPSHSTWWPYDGVERHSVFVPEEAGEE